jgi:hypothetical protein
MCALLIATTLAGAPEPSPARAADVLMHDFENGCGPANLPDFVPDNSAVLRTLFGDFSALPELFSWARDQDAVDYFSPACDAHDRCYGTYGSNALDCDLQMLPDLTGACKKAYLRKDLSWRNAFGLGYIWKAGEFAHCVEAATAMVAAVRAAGDVLGGFGTGLYDASAFGDAQTDAEKAATCDGARQTSYGGIYLPPRAIERGYEGDCSVVDLAYGAGRWAGTSRQFGNAQQVHWLDSPDDVQATWRSLFDSGYALTNLEYGDGWWVAVLTTDTGIGRQFFTNRGRFEDLTDDIRHAWDEGLDVTEVEYGDGRWLMFASADTGIAGQRWVRDVTNTGELNAAVQRELDAGWWLTKLEHDGERWLALFAQGVSWQANGMTCRPTYHETRVAMDEQAAVGRELADLEYGDGSWCGVWFESAATPPPTPSPTAPPTPSPTAPPTPSPTASPAPSPTPMPTATPTPQLVEVPDLGGMTRAVARAMVRSRGLTFEVAGYRDMGAEMAGRVVDQDPMPYGAPVPAGSMVRVWLGAESSFTPTFPAQRTSDRFTVLMPGHEHGDTITRGTSVEICVAISAYYPGEQARPDWVLGDYYPADGPGTWVAGGSMPPGGMTQCYDRDVTGPGGYEMFGISMLNPSTGAVMDFADFWIYVP